MPLKDPEARRRYHRAYMKRYLSKPENKRKHLKRIKRNNAKAKARVKKLISDWKKDGCAVCSEADECCLVAHHLDPSKKRFQIADCVGKFWTKTVQIELDKCICICMNCHAKVHAGIRQLDAP